MHLFWLASDATAWIDWWNLKFGEKMCLLIRFPVVITIALASDMGSWNVKCDDIHFAKNWKFLWCPLTANYKWYQRKCSFHCQQLLQMTLWCLVPPCKGKYSSWVQNGECSITCLWFCGPKASPEVQCWLKVRSSTRKGQVVCVSNPHPPQGRKGCQENWGSECSRDESSHVPGAL